MATAKDFSRLGDIEGVSKYILVRNDGYVVSENYEEAVALSSAIVTSGKLCDSLSDDLEGRRYIYCCVERASGDNILVFSLGRYYLGIIKHSESDPQQLSDTIIGFLKGLA
ncbi:hypothetical protein UWK_02816 [Desulfocapsa sulfexigens DSM 10523]|uniref:Roadblock/LAMTOR2 domain-containing protein n=1 Tax=Desulfocapsa sulfexigens (strain DSM 10523 / SB164P1) TaxID=1167006 RepID=M1PCK7_DESSD|nr:hypothetical protein [Desulfocapsa sulfexigens]AGF79347.1 hypothetical protein UWK_02816 [Desulfocapsa sulfexigens DSM 10523]